MKNINMLIIVLFLFCSMGISAQTVKIITNNQVAETNLNNDDFRKIFLGKKELWSNGNRIVINVISSNSSESAKVFFDTILDMSLVKFRKHWLKRVLSGNGIKPNEFYSDEEMLEFVAKNPGAIGFVSTNANTANVKVLGEL